MSEKVAVGAAGRRRRQRAVRHVDAPLLTQPAVQLELFHHAANQAVEHSLALRRLRQDQRLPGPRSQLTPFQLKGRRWAGTHSGVGSRELEEEELVLQNVRLKPFARQRSRV